MKYRQIIQNFAYSGELANTTVVEWIDEHRQGDARNATPEDLAAVGDAAAAGYLAQIAALEAALVTQAEKHAAEMASLQNPGAAHAGLAQQLAAVYNGLPDEVQAAFAKDYASVAILLDRGRADLARSIVAQLDIPAELEPVRTQILAALAE